MRWPNKPAGSSTDSAVEPRPDQPSYAHMLGGPFRSHQRKGCLAFQCAGESLPSLSGGSGGPGKPVRSPAGSAAGPRPDRPSKITQSKVSAGAAGLIIRAPGIVLVKMSRLGLGDFFLKVPEREPPKENEGSLRRPLLGVLRLLHRPHWCIGSARTDSRVSYSSISGVAMNLAPDF